MCLRMCMFSALWSVPAFLVSLAHVGGCRAGAKPLKCTQACLRLFTQRSTAWKAGLVGKGTCSHRGPGWFPAPTWQCTTSHDSSSTGTFRSISYTCGTHAFVQKHIQEERNQKTSKREKNHTLLMIVVV